MIQQDGIMRPLNAKKDLLQVADLIELCFMGTIDEDGRDYIQYLRRIAKDSETYFGMGGLQRRYAVIQGFVYEVEGRIIGNLSLLPFQKNGEFIYLIANVAVHPAFRRRGIALNLTNEALDYVKKKSAASAWLQVRDDNPPAFLLYKKMGFVEKTRRTTWTLKPNEFAQFPYQSDLLISSRKPRDWEMQKKWLLRNYDDCVRWNLGLNVDHFRPGLLPWIRQFLEEKFINQYSAYYDKKWVGTVSLERTNLFADNLWLATNPEWEDSTIRSLVNFLQQRNNNRKPMSINFPEGRGVSAFDYLGCKKNHTLIWMEARMNIPVHIKF